jgi:dsRNA-specific ribonuclease
VELVEVPKVLGDMLEALLGAVYLDSGHCLATVWGVFRWPQPACHTVQETLPRHGRHHREAALHQLQEVPRNLPSRLYTENPFASFP